MLCHRQEDSRGGGCGPPARVAVPRSTPVGSPLQAAGDKPQKARTENKQKPCSHKFWFDRLGRWGAARRVPERNSPEQSGGGGLVSVTADGTRSHDLSPPSNARSHLSKKTTLASILMIGRWGWNNSPTRPVHCVQEEMGMLPSV